MGVELGEVSLGAKAGGGEWWKCRFGIGRGEKASGTISVSQSVSSGRKGREGGRHGRFLSFHFPLFHLFFSSSLEDSLRLAS